MSWLVPVVILALCYFAILTRWTKTYITFSTETEYRSHAPSKKNQQVGKRSRFCRQTFDARRPREKKCKLPD